MSDTTTKLVEDITKVEWVKNKETNKNEKDAGAGLILVQESFNEKESKLNGFTFTRVTFKTAQAAADHFTRLSKGGKSGDEVVCQMVNSAMAARFRSQATQKFLQKVKTILDDEDAKPAQLDDAQLDEIRKEFNNILISETDALEYIPGEREVSAISGYRKQKDELLKQVKKLKEEGNVAMAKEKLTQYYEVDKLLKAAEAEAEEKLLEMLKD